jgi:DNA-binding protein Fis
MVDKTETETEYCENCGRELKYFFHNCDGQDYNELYGCPVCDDCCPFCKD